MSAGPYHNCCGWAISWGHRSGCFGSHKPRARTVTFQLLSGWDERSVPEDLPEIEGFELRWTDGSYPGALDRPYYREKP